VKSYLLTFLVLLFSLFTTEVYGEKIIIVDNPRTSYSIDQGIEYIEDSSAQLDINLVKTRPFLTNPNASINLGTYEHPSWLKFRVTTNIQDDLYLFISPKWLDYLDIYFINTSGLMEHVATGGGRNINSRSIATANFVIKVPKEMGDNFTVFVKLKTNFLRNPSFKVGTLESHLPAIMTQDAIFHLYMGLLALLFIYNLVLTIIYPKRRNIVFTLYLTCLLTSTIFFQGYDSVYFNVPYLNTHSNLFSYALAILFILSIHEMIKERPISKYIFWTGYAQILSASIFLVIIPFGFEVLGNVCSSIQALVAMIWTTWISVALFRRGINTDFYFIGSCLVFMIGVIIFILGANGIIPFNLFTSQGIVIGTALQTILLSTLISLEIKNQLERQKHNLLELNAEIVQKKNTQEQFAFMAAHNLKRPVSNMEGLTKLYNDNLISREEFLPKLNQSFDQLKTTITEMNQVIEVQQSELKIEPISISDLIEEIKSITKESSNTLIPINWTIEIGITSINSHKAFLKSIVYNLVNNAVKYRKNTPEDFVKISVELQNQRIHIAVEDNGIGMDLIKNKEKIFKLYSRLDFSRDGKGMGLYMVKAQVAQLNGTIEVESKIGVGTTFDVYLPTNTK
jgi:signal transduction histidine kinase